MPIQQKNSAIAQIPDAVTNSYLEYSFQKQLNSLSKSKPGILQGHLIVKKDGSSETTNIIVLLWEKIKGALGLQNMTDRNLIKLKMLQLFVEGHKWPLSPEDVKAIESLAKRAGIIAAGADHFNVNAAEDLLKHFILLHNHELRRYPADILKIANPSDAATPLLPSQVLDKEQPDHIQNDNENQKNFASTSDEDKNPERENERSIDETGASNNSLAEANGFDSRPGRLNASLSPAFLTIPTGMTSHDEIKSKVSQEVPLREAHKQPKNEEKTVETKPSANNIKLLSRNQSKTFAARALRIVPYALATIVGLGAIYLAKGYLLGENIDTNPKVDPSRSFDMNSAADQNSVQNTHEVNKEVNRDVTSPVTTVGHEKANSEISGSSVNGNGTTTFDDFGIPGRPLDPTNDQSIVEHKPNVIDFTRPLDQHLLNRKKFTNLTREVSFWSINMVNIQNNDQQDTSNGAEKKDGNEGFGQCDMKKNDQPPENPLTSQDTLQKEIKNQENVKESAGPNQIETGNESTNTTTTEEYESTNKNSENYNVGDGEFNKDIRDGVEKKGDDHDKKNNLSFFNYLAAGVVTLAVNVAFVVGCYICRKKNEKSGSENNSNDISNNSSDDTKEDISDNSSDDTTDLDNLDNPQNPQIEDSENLQNEEKNEEKLPKIPLGQLNFKYSYKKIGKLHTDELKKAQETIKSAMENIEGSKEDEEILIALTRKLNKINIKLNKSNKNQNVNSSTKKDKTTPSNPTKHKVVIDTEKVKELFNDHNNMIKKIDDVFEAEEKTTSENNLEETQTPRFTISFLYKKNDELKEKLKDNLTKDEKNIIKSSIRKNEDEIQKQIIKSINAPNLNATSNTLQTQTNYINNIPNQSINENNSSQDKKKRTTQTIVFQSNINDKNKKNK